MNFKTEAVQTRLWLGFGIMVLLIVTIACLGYGQSKQLNSASASVSHTHRVISKIERVLSLLKDAETGQRGFLLTSDEQYLAPYNNALIETEDELNALKSLTIDIQPQQCSIVEFRGLIDAKFDELAETIRLHRAGNREEALSIVKTDVGKILMDDIRRVVDEMRNVEHELLRVRKLRSQQATHSYSSMVFGSVGVAFLVAIFVALVTSRKIGATIAMLAQSEATFRVICQSLFDGVMIVDDAGKIVEANEASCDMFLETRDNLIGEDYRVVFDGVTADKSVDWLSDLQSERGDSISRDIVTQEHSIVHVEVSAAPIEIHAANYRLVVVHDVTQRRKFETEKNALQKQLVVASREAGKSEVATGVLHNVGNALNSVIVSTNLIAQQHSHIEAEKLCKVAEMLEENQKTLPNFLSVDPKGKLVPSFIQMFAEKLEFQLKQTDGEIESLRKHVDHISNIVADQQSSAKRSGATESLDPCELMEESLHIQMESLQRHEVEVVRDFRWDYAECVMCRHDVVQILNNLIGNAKDSLVEHRQSGREIQCAVYGDDNEVVFEIRDNGRGVEPGMAAQLFQFGFTTKEQGHGFGLHYSANIATAMDGSLMATSEGIGKGATFRLQIPASCESSLDLRTTKTGASAE